MMAAAGSLYRRLYSEFDKSQSDLSVTMAYVLQRLFKAHRASCLLLILLCMVNALQPAVASLFSLHYLQSLETYDWQTSLVILYGLVSYILCLGFVFYAKNSLLLQLNARFMRSYLPTLWHVIISQSPEKTALPASGDLANRFLSLTQSLEQFAEASLNGLMSTLSVIALGGLIFSIHSALAWGYFFCISLYWLLQGSLARKHVQFQQQSMQGQDSLSGFLNENLQQITKIRSYNIAAKVQRSWWQLMQSTIQAQFGAEQISLWEIGLDAALWLSLSARLFLHLYFHHGQSDLGTNLALILCTAQLITFCQQQRQQCLHLMQLQAAFKRMQEIYQHCQSPRMASGITLSLTGQVSFKHLRFYRQQRCILRDMNLDIMPGEFIAIIGPSGCGKSTILKLLLGLLQPDAGRIYLQGQDIETLDLRSVRQQIASVLQDARCFPGDILTNLSLEESLSEEEAWKCLDVVGLSDAVRAMPMGLYTHISDVPSESLSGGQQQKLQIARALARQPKLLLLDEATSALDNQSQAKIHRYLKQQRITRIVVAHRLSTIAGADRVFELQNGMLTELGDSRLRGNDRVCL